jgi:hypothetical protein
MSGERNVAGMMGAGQHAGIALALGIGLGAALGSLAAPPAVNALHSVPGILEFWDNDNDGFGEAPEASVYFQKISTGWNSYKSLSASYGATAWWSTEWDPHTTTSSSVATIRVDGTKPCGTGGWADGDIALTCLKGNTKGGLFGDPYMIYYDIYDVDIGIDLTPGIYVEHSTWEWNGEVEPSSTEYSLRGVLTHEFGHGISLNDLACGTPETMCGNGSDGITTWLWRTLEADDIGAANYQYGP